ncbi:MAG: ATP-binding cassette domain-containing protein [Candidatus Cloacimonetes bacterium]|jgi:ABC-2 type transport system ATP-binding protein|nr:ATP-binding cassette domain-containing protein [Candidatus Cloacimonadota bacterium]MDD4155091.1 ATP-binding cassette domain-containing protein [Candidatus Cloacimonadota bacterium]
MIELQNLIKDYGSLRAVDTINFKINEGEILGFLGPNGAGKSTTLKMITCYLTPTDGNIQIDNYNVYEHSKEIRNMIGYLPEHNPLYLEMTVYDYLKFVAEVRQISENDFNKTLRDTIKKCGLTEVISRPIKNLSKGYRQRVGIAQAIIHNPKILILDEPTTGLDPNQIAEIRELIKELGKEKTLIISSHILQEVQAVCDRIVIINNGKIVGQGTTEELKMSNQRIAKLNLELIAPETELYTIKEYLPQIDVKTIKVNGENVKLEINYPQDKDYRKDIFNFIKQKDWTILEMQLHTSTLEDIFRNLTSGGKNE